MIWVIGERHGAARGATNERLAQLIGVSADQLMDAVLWLNLWEYPGTRAERYVRLVEEAADDRDAIVLLGRRVQHAFGLDHAAPFSTVTRNAGRGPVIISIPHPSGLNRWWNDPDHQDDAAIALRAVWGSHR